MKYEQEADTEIKVFPGACIFLPSSVFDSTEEGIFCEYLHCFRIWLYGMLKKQENESRVIK